MRLAPSGIAAIARPGAVRRPALIERLAASEVALATVIAPAGYGKSTLLAEWAEQDKRPFLWLTPDARDVVNAAAMASFVLQRLAESQWSDPGSTDCPWERATRDPVGSLRRLMQSLQSANSRFVVVLDDIHVADPAALTEIAEVMLKYRPTGSTLALGSRCELALPVGRLRAAGALAEVRMPDLALTPAEAAIVLHRFGLDLDFEAVQALVRLTEGWPAAMYLAALASLARDDAGADRAASAPLSGAEHHLRQYLESEVLAALPRPLLTFSVRTSVLDELSGAACDAVLGRSGSGRILAELAQASPLLRPLDPSHGSYRWHGPIRDVLRARLREMDSGLELDLHRRASAWCEREADLDRAIAHAILARDATLTGDLLWPRVAFLLARGRHRVVQNWLAGFGASELADCPSLALSAAHSCLAAGDVDRARHWAAAAAAGLERIDAHAALAPSVRAGLATLDAFLARSAAVMGRAAAEVVAVEPPDSPWRPVGLLLEGTALHLTGDRDAARLRLERGGELGAAESPAVLARCLAQQAMIAMEDGDWATATELTDRAASVLARRDLGGDPLSAVVFAAVAAARARQGRSDEAKQALHTGLDLLARLGEFIPWYSAEARILLAHASLWLADIAGARTLLAEASRLARRIPDATIFTRWFDAAWTHVDTLAETHLAGPASLTIAELRVLRFLPSHRSFREIAAQLGVSANTVKTQAHAVYSKLGAASRSEAVARASDAGLLGTDPRWAVIRSG